MPRQNRVNPFGELIVTDARGAFMGNRGGALHNDQGELTDRRWTSSRWIICLLEFKERRRPLMAPGCYTELFFLDEATALAAGHRPCAECRREDFKCFKKAWLKGNPEYGFADNVKIGEIDKVLQQERVTRTREKVTFPVELGSLPEGTFVSLPSDPESAYLVWRGELRSWSPGGYGQVVQRPGEFLVDVLTPASTVNAIRAGYVPQVSL